MCLPSTSSSRRHVHYPASPRCSVSGTSKHHNTTHCRLSHATVNVVLRDYDSSHLTTYHDVSLGIRAYFLVPISPFLRSRFLYNQPRLIVASHYLLLSPRAVFHPFTLLRFHLLLHDAMSCYCLTGLRLENKAFNVLLTIARRIVE